MPWAADTAEPSQLWVPDLLGGFEQITLPLTAAPLPGEQRVVATLVRRTLAADPERDDRRRAVLYLPGWNDYFFHVHVAQFLERQGFTVYALDPRRSGRSLRDPQYRDYVTDLADYSEELDRASEIIGARQPSLTLMGHSTGGLVGSLWASMRPGRVGAVVLNSPWLAMWGAVDYAHALRPPLGVVARRDPLTVIPLPDLGERYLDCVHASRHGEWDYDPALKAPGGVPIRAGWLRAILRGHRRINAGLGIACPVFMACSDRSFLTATGWSERARTSDIVLDVANMAARAPRLGSVVTLVRIERGFHDLALSVADAREQYFRELGRWLDAYVPAASV